MDPKASQQQRSLLPKAEPSRSPSFDSVPAAGGDSDEPPAKRKCVSSACMPCRKRKSKCNGARPECHACKEVYKSPCSYDIDSDKRRKGALKREIKELKEDIGPRNRILEALRAGTDADAEDIIQIIRSSRADDWDSIAARIQSLGKNGKGGPSEHLEPELSDMTVKAIAGERGDAATYGHTSNLRTDSEVEHGPLSDINSTGKWTDLPINQELLEHLLSVYFSWSHPQYTLFSEEIFMHAMQHGKLKYCTPMLVNAVLAVGTHFSDCKEVQPSDSNQSTLGDRFFDEAERLFRQNERPCLTTVQALAVMSLYRAMHGKDSSGWLYICQAIGMVIELGLNKDEYSQAKSMITDSEIGVRRITFWGTYVLQTGWAICAGRLSLLPHTAIRVEKPGVPPGLETKLWKPHGLPGYNPDVKHHLEQPGMKYTILSYAGQLCSLVDEVIQMFYAPRDRMTSRRLQLQHERLERWYSALPKTLAIRPGWPSLPQVIALHMYYWNCVIHLFRPFMKLEYVHSTGSTKSPKPITIEAANKISELLQLSIQTYGLRRVGFMYTHCISTASIIHLVVVSGTPTVPETSLRHLCDAISAMQQIRSTFPIIDRYMGTLRSLAQEWFRNNPMPHALADAFSAIDIGTPTSAPSSPPNTTPIAMVMPRRDSASDILVPYKEKEFGASEQPEFYWSPFPNQQDFMLMAPASHGPGQHMDLSYMLGSGTGGDPSQLTLDGFTWSDDSGPSYRGHWYGA
ncbi:Nitrogen assimilation transcription factor nit-4 [Lachnellula suecica]|uniref:Nitrogen assimilation transcription factor nit-4 n=1 Tax=Lachnellula suecica TaxID=602035 RepID=A0A8T9CGU2_9HELO|nr:Nitrogen assimilation transcription factor nit-4 [Lachnellula suecica]